MGWQEQFEKAKKKCAELENGVEKEEKDGQTELLLCSCFLVLRGSRRVAPSGLHKLQHCGGSDYSDYSYSDQEGVKSLAGAGVSCSLGLRRPSTSSAELLSL